MGLISMQNNKESNNIIISAVMGIVFLGCVKIIFHPTANVYSNFGNGRGSIEIVEPDLKSNSPRNSPRSAP